MDRAEQLFVQRKWAEAASAYEEIAQREAGNLRAWQRLGACREALKEPEKALAAYQRAAQLANVDAPTLYRLGCLQALSGQIDQAVRSLDRALDRGFSDRAALESDPELEAIRKDDRFAYLLRRMAVAPGHLLTQLDFWLGEWDVFGADGARLGRSRIEKRERGFAVLEHWTAEGGGTATGLTYYDPAERKWKQVWVSSGGDAGQYESRPAQAGLQLEGTFRGADGRIRPARVTLTLETDGRVRQVMKQSKDEGQSWITYRDCLYVPARPSGGGK